jgi:hypothetical protein
MIREDLKGLDALYIGGGFPEMHAELLAENRRFKDSLRQAIEAGLPVYAAVPHGLRHRFIDTFRNHPKPFSGIAGSPLISRIIKILDRYGLVPIFMPIIFLAIVMTMLPDYLFWILVVWVSAYIVINIIKLFKK